MTKHHSNGESASKADARAAVEYITDAAPSSEREVIVDAVADDLSNEAAIRRRLLDMSLEIDHEYEALKQTPNDRAAQLRLIEKLLVQNEALQRHILRDFPAAGRARRPGDNE